MKHVSSGSALAEILDRNDPSMLGVILSGSAARGMETEHSDVDVMVVLADGANPREVLRSPAIDEIPVFLSELEATPAAFGTPDWYQRWALAWVEVVRDDTGGRISAAARRQATLDDFEQRWLLTDGDRLDGWVNFAYRAAKSDRDGRPLERRFDAAESVPWFLDVVFTLAGRVRPYNKYLAWELREHPLDVPEWSADRLLAQLEAMLDGDLAAVRSAYAVVERECRRYDAEHDTTALTELLASWGSELDLLR